MSEPFIRIRASAAVVREGKILLVECFDPDYGHHYNLPGGGVQPGELLRDAAAREVREETTAQVEVGDLLLAYEVMLSHPEAVYGHNQSVGFIFRGRLANGSEPHLPPEPDNFQTGVVWLPLEDLPGSGLLPRLGAEIIRALSAPDGDALFFSLRD